MKYSDVKRHVLELINQSTIAGENVPLSYNNQADYVRRIPALLNQGITKIRGTRLPKINNMQLTGGELHGSFVKYALPADCRELISGGIRRMGDCGRGLFAVPGNQWFIQGGQLWLPADHTSDGTPCPVEDNPGNWYSIEYRAFSPQYPIDPADDYALDERSDVIQAAEYYAAAMLVIMEDQFTYGQLMNEYESRLAAMMPPVTAEMHPIQDVYGI